MRVFDAAGAKVQEFVPAPGSTTVTVGNLGAKYKVEWDTTAHHDQVLIEGVAGKFDIGGFGTTQGAPTPDQVLNFVARVVDGDGDSSTDAFAIGIDGTGIFDDDIVNLVGLP